MERSLDILTQDWTQNEISLNSASTACVALQAERVMAGLPSGR